MNGRCREERERRTHLFWRSSFQVTFMAETHSISFTLLSLDIILYHGINERAILGQSERSKIFFSSESCNVSLFLGKDLYC
jgi:hypothetical protein